MKCEVQPHVELFHSVVPALPCLDHVCVVCVLTVVYHISKETTYLLTVTWNISLTPISLQTVLPVL